MPGQSVEGPSLRVREPLVTGETRRSCQRLAKVLIRVIICAARSREVPFQQSRCSVHFGTPPAGFGVGRTYESKAASVLPVGDQAGCARLATLRGGRWCAYSQSWITISSPPGRCRSSLQRLTPRLR